MFSRIIVLEETGTTTITDLFKGMLITIQESLELKAAGSINACMCQLLQGIREFSTVIVMKDKCNIDNRLNIFSWYFMN